MLITSRILSWETNERTSNIRIMLQRLLVVFVFVFFFQLFLVMARGEFGDTGGREENLQ